MRRFGPFALVATLLPVFVAACATRVEPPLAKAVAAGQTHPVGVAVPVDASSSTDPAGLRLTFSWRFFAVPAGSVARLSSTSVPAPFFTPDREGTYGLTATVSNGTLSASQDLEVEVRCGIAPPVVAIVPPASTRVGAPVEFSVTVTDGDDGTCGVGGAPRVVSSLGAIPPGSRASVLGERGGHPWFTPDLPGTYELVSHATDLAGITGVARTAVVVEACGTRPPSIESVSPITGVVDRPLRLAAVVADADVEAACESLERAWSWRVSSRPAGSTALLSGVTLASPTFTPDVPGRYAFEVSVTDAGGHRATRVHSLDADGCGANAPVVTSIGLEPASAAVGAVVAAAAVVTDADAETCGLLESLTHEWRLVEIPRASGASLVAADTATPWFIADVAGTYGLELRVTDASGRRSAPVRRALEVSACGSAPPSVEISVGVAPRIGTSLGLAAEVSDADTAAPCSQPATYAYSWSVWDAPRGSVAALSGASSRTPTFEPDLAGTYRLHVAVVDASGRRAENTSVVEVGTCGASAPVLSLSASPSAPAVGATVSLKPAITDADAATGCGAPGATATLSWVLLARPAGSAVALSAVTTGEPSFVPDVPGTYVVRAIARDATGLPSQPAELTIPASACGANSPVATASASTLAPRAGQRVTLTGVVTDADDSDSCRSQLPAQAPVRVQWRLLEAPPGSTAALADGTRLADRLTTDRSGRYRVEFTAIDATGRVGRAEVALEAGACGAAAPAVTGTLATTAPRVGAPVQFTSSATDDDNAAPCTAGQALTLDWTLVSRPAGSTASIDRPREANASFTPDRTGAYVARVAARDSTGRTSAPVSVTVNVAACGGRAPVARVQVTSPPSGSAAESVTIDPLLACTVQLDARGSSDDDATCGLAQAPEQLRYSWEQIGAPAASTAVLHQESVATPWFAPDVGGTYEFRVWAADSERQSLTPATVKFVHKSFSITGLTPPVACENSVPVSLRLTATGQGFLRAGTTLPAVLFGRRGTAPAARTVTAISGCGASGVTGVESCSTIDVSIPTGLTRGDYDVTVRNPGTDACAATAVFSVGPVPTVTATLPNRICGADDPLKASQFLMNVRGTGFVAATQLALNPAGGARQVQYISDTELNALFDTPRPPPRTHSMTASNGASCPSAPLSNALTVLDLPLVFFVDPPVIFNGIQTQATAFVSRPNLGAITAVRIRLTGATSDFQQVPFTYDPARANQVRLTIPANLPVGDYDVLVTDADTCTSRPVRSFRVTNTLSLALGSVDPPFAWRDAVTSVDLRTASPLPSGKVAFLGLPRVYLNPTAGGTAVGLSAVSLVSADLVNALVPKNLATGTYDVIVVNPDGAVGILRGGFKVTQVAPPLVDAIVPGSIPSTLPQNITLRGSGFTASSVVRFDCTGTGNSPSVTVTSRTATSLVTTLSGSLVAGSLCVAVVTNADGSYGEYAALGVTNSSENLQDFALATTMTRVRRAPAAAAGRPTRSARFIYAIGGDDGTRANVTDTVELAPLDRFGALGGWRLLPTKLPRPLSFAGAQTLGRFVYVAGGFDGALRRADVLRAEVLTPAQAPQVSDLLLELDAAGLSEGTWFYRVSAVMGPGDDSNPAGETLAGDPFPIAVPAGLPVATPKLKSTLTWSPVPGAASYRVYRSATANLGAGSERLLATVAAPTVSYVDVGGGVSVTPADVPRKLGDLGAWKPLPSMNTAREGLAFASATDPVDATKAYLYAAAGHSGVVQANYERIGLTLNADGTQTVGPSWTQDATNTLKGDKPNDPAPARWQVGAFVVTSVVTSRVGATDTWIHVGPGRDATTGAVNAVNAAQVTAGGALSTWMSVNAPTNYAGYAFAAAANQLFLYGGDGAAPSAKGISAQLCGPGYQQCSSSPPALRSWNALSGNADMRVARYLPATVVESARIFVLGGATTGGAALSSTESIVW